MPGAVTLIAITFNIGVIGASTLLGLGIAAAGYVVVTAAKALNPDFASRARSITVQLKQSVTPHRLIYGKRRVSGAITFIETTEKGKFLHLVITLAAHEVHNIGTAVFDNIPIFQDQLDGNGDAVEGHFENHVRIVTSLGDEAAGVQPFPTLEADTVGWTSQHNQTGHAKVYVRLFRSSKTTLWRQVPNMSWFVEGFEVNDHRDLTAYHTSNVALCIRHWIRRAQNETGLGVAFADLDLDSLDVAADACDEFVETLPVSHSVDIDSAAPGGVPPGVDTASNSLIFTGDDDSRKFLELQPGDRVQLFNVTDTLPSAIAVSTDYYVIVKREMRQVLGDLGDVFTRIKLATSYRNALEGTSITFADTGAGAFDVRKTAEPRFTCDYVIEANRPPYEILEEMSSGMNPLGGGTSSIGGQWFFRAGEWVAPTLSAFDENDFLGDIPVQTQPSRKDRKNAVSGLFQSPQNFEQPLPYPQVDNSLYLAEDGDELLVLPVDFPVSSRPAQCQRLAKIVLEDGRQAITFSAPMKASMMQAAPGDVVPISLTRLGWSSKEFRILDMALAFEETEPPEGGGESAIALIVRATFKETAEAIYDWSEEETLIDLAPNTGLVSAFVIDAPTNLTISEQMVLYNGLRVIGTTTMAWTASLHAFVDKYDVQWRISGGTWSPSATALATEDETLVDYDILDLEPGLWEFRVRARTNLGQVSGWLSSNPIDIVGLSARPSAITGLQAIVIEGAVILSWDAIDPEIDLDVIIGGHIEIRHDEDTATGDWVNSVPIGGEDGIVPGDTTQATLPLRSGHYCVKAVDSSGNKSTNEICVKVLQVSQFTHSTEDTQTEHAVFGGTKTNCSVVSSNLEIDVDGGGDVLPVASYEFTNNPIDITGGAADVMRFTPHIQVTTFLENDLIDDRTDNIDDWINFDGVEGSECDVWMEFRITDDDPAGAPTWSDWMRLDANIASCRGVEYRLQLRSNDAAANIQVSELSVVAEST